MTVNKLKLNQDKTEFLVVASQAQHRKLTDVKLTLGDAVLEPSESLRILGVIFDNRLLHDAHVATISRTVKFHLRNLTLIRKYLDENSTHAAVRALILSRLEYCNSLLYGTSTKNLHTIQLLQNQAARLIYKKPKSTHTSPLIQSLHWLPVPRRIEYKNAVLTYQCISKQAPSYLCNLLQIRQSLYNFRSSSSVVLNTPRSRTNIGSEGFSVTAPKCWNRLPNLVRSVNTLSTFKSQLKTHLYPK